VNDYYCDCLAGYEDKNCSTQSSLCDSNPCLHGGACVDGLNSFTCTCAAGYTGDTCGTGECYG
jgi:Notch-like protein